MSFSVLSKSPHFPDSPLRAVELLLILAAIAALSYLLANPWVATAMTTVGLIGFLFDRAFYIPAAILVALIATVIGRRLRGESLRQARFGASLPDIVIIGAGFLLYELGRSLSEGEYDEAVANAEHLLRIQQSIRLPDEAVVQGWVFDNLRIMSYFNTIYSYFFLAITIGGLVWLSFNAPSVYRTTRNAMGVATFSALLFFALVPMAPPRLVDASDLIGSHARVGLSHGYMNEFAAMPSLHVGWMALIGWAFARTIRGLFGKLIGVALPVVMMVTVVVTGHHYWMDGIIGAALCVAPAIAFDRCPALPASSQQPLRPAAAGPAYNGSPLGHPFPVSGGQGDESRSKELEATTARRGHGDD